MALAPSENRGIITALAQNADFVVRAGGGGFGAAFFGAAAADRWQALEPLFQAAVDVLAGALVRELGTGRPALDVHHHIAPAHRRVLQSLPVIHQHQLVSISHGNDATNASDIYGAHYQIS